MVTPISIIVAVAQAAVDKNRLAMNILGSTVSTKLQFFFIVHCNNCPPTDIVILNAYNISDGFL